MRRGLKFSSSIRVVNGRCFFTKTGSLFIEQGVEERAREDELRQKVQQKYRGMQIPPITNHQYGHFSTMGINETAAQQAAGDASSQSFWGSGGQSFQNRGRVDWIMLLTGCVLVYFSGKILFTQFTRGVNGLEMPLWTASVDMQAKHLLFAVQFNRHEQDQLKKDFEAARQTNPLTNFFEWVRTCRPEFCSGRKYNSEYVMSVLISSLCSSDSTQLASLARALQQSMKQQTGDPLQRVDEFVERLQATGYLLQTMRSPGPINTFAHNYQIAPTFVPPVKHTQGGAERSDLNSALEVKNGEVHSSTPFDDTK
jgi:hypothetical protein